VSNRQNRFIHGPMLRQICEKIGVKPTQGNKEVVKAMLKKARGIDSLKDLDDAGKAYFIEKSAILLASEFAMVIDLPGEYGTEEMDMRNFLKHIYHDRSTTIPREDSSQENQVHEKGMGEDQV
jgi:hypothetical protein